MRFRPSSMRCTSRARSRARNTTTCCSATIRPGVKEAGSSITTTRISRSTETGAAGGDGLGHHPSMPISGERAPTDRDYRLLVESLKDYAVFMLDPQGVVRTWNAGAQLLKGYTADE